MNNAVADNWLETRSGLCFDYLAPTKEMVDIQDIAWALGKLCRFNGQCQRFYSVAEHCVLLVRWMNERNETFRRASREPVPNMYKGKEQMVMLLHDAAEAYCGDIVRPLKQHLLGFQKIEREVLLVIGEKFGVSLAFLDEELSMLDARITRDERAQAMGKTANKWAVDGLEPLGVNLHFWDPETAGKRFLQEFERICAEMSSGQ